MKSILMLVALAGLSLGQTLPYEHAYKKANGWREKMVFFESPDEPGVVYISLYSYVDAQTPYYKLKETKPADAKKALAFVAECQANDEAMKEYERRAYAAEMERKREVAEKEEQDRRDARNARKIEDAVERAVEEGVEDALERDRNTRRK